MGKKYRQEAVIPLTPAADYSTKTGYLVDWAGETATISTSTTVPVKGVIIEGNDTTAGYATEKVAVAILGAFDGTVPMRLGGTVAKGAKVIQNTDGTVITDPGTGTNRVVVGVACEAGNAGDNIEVATLTPVYLT